MSSNNDIKRVRAQAEAERLTLEKFITALDSYSSLEVRIAMSDLEPDAELMILKLEAAFASLGPVGQIHAAGLLLQEGKRTHLNTYLQGFSSDAEKVREAAFGMAVNTSDRSIPNGQFGAAFPKAPFTRDELFNALRPLLDNKNHPDYRRAVYKFANQDFIRGRSYLVGLLTHQDASERLSAANILLKNGTDAGALNILEDFIVSAPKMDPLGSPRWYDIQGISRTFAGACYICGPDVIEKVGQITYRAISKALASPDWKAHTQNGFLDIWTLIEVLRRAKPEGFETLFIQIVSSDLWKETRGRALGTLAASDGNGESHQDIILTSLDDPAFRQHAAQGMCRYGPEKLTVPVIDKIETLLRDEDDETSIKYLAVILNKVAPDRQSVLEEKLNQMPRVAAMNFFWKIENYSVTDIYRWLRKANIIDAVPEEYLEQRLLSKDGDLDIFNILHESGNRLAVVSMKQNSTPEHGEAFKDLLALLRPPLELKHIIQTLHDKAAYEPLENNPDIIKRTELGTVSIIEYVLHDQLFSFRANPIGRWLDMAAIYQHANDLLQRIDHPQRLYAMDVDWGEHSPYFSADWKAYPEVQKKLRIPVINDLERQRQAGIGKVAHMLGAK